MLSIGSGRFFAHLDAVVESDDIGALTEYVAAHRFEQGEAHPFACRSGAGIDFEGPLGRGRLAILRSNQDPQPPRASGRFREFPGTAAQSRLVSV